MAFKLQGLLAYQEASRFVREIIRILRRVSPAEFELADQLRRAAISISANIAEGYGRWHIKDKCQFYRFALGSTTECVALIDAARDTNLINSDQYNSLLENLDHIARLVNGLIRSVSNRPCN
jgi:four helix bundle protein